jgi:hypothetical protein
MGKASKAHRAKIAKRNENIRLEKKQTEKKYLQMMEQQLQAFQNKFSGLTENDELSAENIIDVLSNEEVTPTEDQVSELEK